MGLDFGKCCMILCVYYWVRSMVGLVRLASVVCFGSRDGLEYLSYDRLRNDFRSLHIPN